MAKVSKTLGFFRAISASNCCMKGGFIAGNYYSAESVFKPQENSLMESKIFSSAKVY